jgi:Mrp family chromosome partitioning ATPase
MSDLIDTVSGTYDYVLIDAPPVLPVTDAAVLSRVTSGVLLVVGAGRVKENEVRASLEALEAVGATPLGVVLTMLPTRGPDASPYGGAGAYAMKEDKVELDPDDVPIPSSGSSPQPVVTGPVAHRSARAPGSTHPDVTPDAVSAARPNN